MSDKLRIFTRDILELDESLENRGRFVETFSKVSTRMGNCSCGDAFLKQASEEIYKKAIRKFIIDE